MILGLKDVKVEEGQCFQACTLFQQGQTLQVFELSGGHRFFKPSSLQSFVTQRAGMLTEKEKPTQQRTCVGA